jgi:hypothetical protein
MTICLAQETIASTRTRSGKLQQVELELVRLLVQVEAVEPITRDPGRASVGNAENRCVKLICDPMYTILYW